MRLFSSHLTDDSSNELFGSAVKTAVAAINSARDYMGLKSRCFDHGDLETGQQSIIHQAEDMLKNDTITEFYRHNQPNVLETDMFNKNEPDTLPFDGVDGVYSHEFNLPQYAINNYNVRVAAPIFDRSDTQRSVNATLTHGRLSMFNPYTYLNDYTGVSGGTLHFRDTQFKQNKIQKYAQNPTIKNLVQHPVGSSRYFYEDFAYCAELGKLSNNHLITLRKFAAPVNDNIFLGSSPEDDKKRQAEFPPDIARLVCWFGGDDNKLEDIVNMSFHASWKDMKGEWQEVDTGTDNESSGFLGILSNLTNPSYIQGFVNGTNSGAGLGKLLGNNSRNKLADQYRKRAYRHYDKNKIYTPKNIIRDTKYYEGIMNYTNKFTLTFRYKMRSFNDLNQKMAFLDLISNILNVTYRRATWWGGDHNFIGTPQNQKPFKIANAMVDKVFNKAGGIWNKLFESDGKGGIKGGSELLDALRSMDFGQLMSKIVESAKNFWNSAANMGSQIIDSVTGGNSGKGNNNSGNSDDGSNKLMNLIQKSGNIGTQVLKGAVKNQLGRPQIYALNSILNGAATGFWHVTVGNPFNPIVVMGNMVITGVQLYQTGPLTIDDFPEELVVKISLEHGKPRDITTISKMYTRGYGELYSTAAKQSRTTRNYNRKNVKRKIARRTRRK